jgi:hypothetical protein
MYGQQVTKGIKYIKINKIDQEGKDNTQNLQTAKKLRLNYPDVGVQEYTIQTSQPFADYYLFGVIPNDNTSSLNEILDYSFVATSGSSFTYNNIPFSPDQFFINRVQSYGTTTGNNLLYFTGSSGIYNPKNTPNKVLQVRISGSGTLTSGVIGLNCYVAKEGGSRQIEIIDASYSGGVFDKTIILSESFFMIENDRIGFGLTRNAGLNSLTINDFHVSVSLHDSSPITTSSSLVTITPSYEFQFSDYNILNGNIDIARTSRQYLDVDYSTGVLTPTNITTIISGTATPAPVQDSNYTLQRNIRPRYNGSRTSSPDFNITL